MTKIIEKFIASSTLCLATTVMANPIVLNSENPEGYQQFRMDYADMVDTANPTRLGWRMFYVAPSEGPNAKWFDAVKQGNFDLVKQMVEGGQDLEVKDEASLGQTALGWAAFIGYEDIVDYLIEKNANLFATDRGDVTSALKSAGLGKNVDVFKKIYSLVKDDVDLDNQTNDMQGETILIVASSNDRQDIVEFLLEQGANPNLVTTEKDKDHPAYDQDALTFACMRGNAGTIKLLLEHGAINHRTQQAACDY